MPKHIVEGVNLSGNILMNGGKVTTLLDPSSDDDLATKGYSDGLVTKDVFWHYPSTMPDAIGDFLTFALTPGATRNFTFMFPRDFNSIVSLTIVFIPQGGAGGASRTISFNSSYAANGQSNTTHTGSISPTGYVLPADGTLHEIDISSIFSSAAANDYAGFGILYAVGSPGTLNALGVRLRYS